MQINFCLSASFNALYLANSEKVLTHTHTHTHFAPGVVLLVLAYAREKEKVAQTPINKGLNRVPFV